MADVSSPPADGVRWWWPIGTVVAGSLLVRGVLALAGNGFRSTHLYPSTWHLIELDALVARPFAPLWDLHTTPPLFNVAVGVLLRWTPFSESVTFRLVFVAGGVFGAVALCQVLRAVGCRWWVASLAAVVTFSKPGLLAFETFVNQESFVIPLLMGVMWAVAVYARQPTLGRYGLVLALATALVLTRALFTPLWLVALLAALLAWRPPVDRRRLALVGVLPLVAVLGLMVKNEVRFGSFSTSSWSGMNLSRVALSPLGPERTERMIAAGELSPMARIPWFSQYEEYEPLFGPCRGGFGVRALDDPVKSDSPPSYPNANFNAACYVPVYERAMSDSLAAIRYEPGVYARSVWANSVGYLSDPPSHDEDYGGLTGTAADALYRVHDVLGLEYGTEARYPSIFAVSVDVQFTILVALVVVTAAGVRSLRRRIRGSATGRDLVVLVAALTVVQVTVVSVTCDAFENGRFRAPLDPILYGAVLAGALELGARARQRRRTAGVTSDPGVEAVEVTSAPT